jgi:ribonuclease HI
MSDSARFLAFVDGSSLSNPGGPGGTGFVVLDRSRPALRFGGTRFTVDGDFAVTNNRMELRAVLEAFEGLPAGETVHVVSDSQYVLNALTRWIHGWRKKGWKTAAGQPVLNRDLIEAADARARELTVSWTWVRGHRRLEGGGGAAGLSGAGAWAAPPERASDSRSRPRNASRTGLGVRATQAAPTRQRASGTPSER